MSVLIAMITMAAQPAPSTPSASGYLACLRSGSWVEFMVVGEVSSDRAHVGDLVRLRVQQPVMIEEKQVIPVGTPAFGVVDLVSKGRHALKNGALVVHMTHIRINDREVNLQGDFRRGGFASVTDTMLKTSLLPIHSLFSPGNAGKLKAGELVSARVDGDYAMTGNGDANEGVWRPERIDGAKCR